MPEDIYEQLLKIPQEQLVELALAGLERQADIVTSVIEKVLGQLDGLIDVSGIGRIYLVGCGDSYFAAISARYAFETLTGLPTVALESMEFSHYSLLPTDTLVIVISSGGQVSMSIEAALLARKKGVGVIGVTAQQTGQMAQEVPCLVTNPNLSNKDYVDQAALILGNFNFSLAALYLVALYIGHSRGYLDNNTRNEIEAEITAVPTAIRQAMNHNQAIRAFLDNVSDEADFYFLGAGPSYGAALFYQAKFFEQAQRPVYGVQLEEFAHEQFFLLQPDKDAQVWFIVPGDRSQERAMKVMASCKEMGACLTSVTSNSDSQLQERVSFNFSVETRSEMFSPLISVVPGQILGIHAFARWGNHLLFSSQRSRQLAITKRLTRDRNPSKQRGATKWTPEAQGSNRQAI